MCFYQWIAFIRTNLTQYYVHVISYYIHVISYCIHVLSYFFMSVHIFSCIIVLFHVFSFFFMHYLFFHARSCFIHVLSYLFMHYLVFSCIFIFIFVLSCYVNVLSNWINRFTQYYGYNMVVLYSYNNFSQHFLLSFNIIYAGEEKDL